MDNLRKRLLARPAFAGNEHRHVGRGHLRGHLDGVVQRRRVADDAEPLLDGLNFLRSQGYDCLLGQCFTSLNHFVKARIGKGVSYFNYVTNPIF